MDSSQFHHFIPPTFSPGKGSLLTEGLIRMDPDGDEFPSWSDENNYDANKKVYRSELKMMGNPPPPVPMSEPPPEDETPPPLPSSVPPIAAQKALLARRSSSVEDKKRIFTAQPPSSNKVPSPMPRSSSQEPSKKSVKDKIAMFSSHSSSKGSEESTDGFNTLPHASTIRNMSTSTSSLPRSAASLSKSSDNLLQGMNVSASSTNNKPSTTSSSHSTDKWKISQSTFDLSPRKNSTDSNSSCSSSSSAKNVGKHFGLHGTNLTSTQNSYSTSKIMHERSQSMLDVGQQENQQQPSYQRVSSTYRYNNLAPKAEVLNSTSLMESRRKANLTKLRGLVIPDKTRLPTTSSSVIDLPTIISKDAVIPPPLSTTVLTNKMEQSQPRQVIRTESFDSYNNENKSAKSIVGSTTEPDISDWKLPCAVPKYSPAFKRRSLNVLTPYQTAVTPKTVPVAFSAGTTTTTPPTTTTTTTNYKTNTPEPKSLESLTSPHSDSSFEFSANSPRLTRNEQPQQQQQQLDPRTKVFTHNTPPAITARKTSLTKGTTGNNNETTTKDAGAEIQLQSNIDAKNRVNDNNVNGTKYNGKGKLEDSDNDSAVSSSRSSISHGLSPPNSPTPLLDADNSKPNSHDLGGEGDDSSNSDEGWRVLKPQSVEAINRKNVLASAKFSSGGGRGDENSSGQSRRSDDDEADAEDTESSCSEVDMSSDKKRRPSLTNRLGGQIRRIPNAKVDTEEDEEELVPQASSTPQHSQQSSMDVGEFILPELTESPLQAIFDMEVQMAYINEICDALPTRSGDSGSSRYFNRRDSEATVIERPIIKERKHSEIESQTDSGGDRRARNRSSSGNESDFSSSISVGSQHHSHHGGVTSDSKSSAPTMDKPDEKWSTLEKKYSKSLTAVNLLGNSPATIITPTATASKHNVEPSLPTPMPSQYSSNDGFEKSIDRMMEKSVLSDAKGKAASTARIPRGRNDFKSLSEKWQQLTSDGTKQVAGAVGVTPTTTSPAVTKPPLFEKPQLLTSSPSSYRSTVTAKAEPQDYTNNDTISPPPPPPHHHSHHHHQQQPAVVIHSTSLSSKMDAANISLPCEGDDAEGSAAWTPERRIGERHLNSSDRNSEIVVPMMSSTKRSVSVNDIRRAFEKAEIAVNSYGRDDNCTLKNGSKDVDGLSVPSAHFRVSSFDSTTSEESSATTPAGIYGSVNSLVSSAARDPYGSITSLASSTSLISPQELQQLIDDANQSLEEAGTPSHEVCVIILHREYAGGSLGITLAGGADYETKEITVHKVLTGSIADRDGRVHRGDRVLSINGKSTKGLTHREGLNLLKAPRTEVVLVVSRGRRVFQTIEETSVTLDRAVEPLLNGTLASLLENDDNDGIKWGPIKTVMLIKYGAGLGFSLDGGKGSIHGDKPLTVKKIFVGGPAEKCGQLKVGDLIVSINNVNMSSKSRTEAWNFMKKLGDGSAETEVKINVRSPLS